jgi:hypothetical protein
MKSLLLTLACWVLVAAQPGVAQDTVPAAPTEEAGAAAPEKGDSAPKKPVEPKSAAAAASHREPFKITREFEARMEEVEPPEIEVTGIFRAKGKTVALAKLALDKVEGRVVLRPGMRVSIPKPDRENSESERWMTYFTVREITTNGMVIVLENGETVWYPVMGELD